MGAASEVLAQVRCAVDAALALETWQLRSDDVAELVEGLAVEASRLAAARLRLLAEAEEQRVTGPGGASTAGWYASVTNSRQREARPTVAMATAMRASLAPTGAALAAGALTVEHAGVIHRVMTKLEVLFTPSVADRPGDPVMGPADRAEALAEGQSTLVELATRLDPDQLAVAGRHLLARAAGPRADEAEAAAIARAADEAGLTLVQLDDGTWFGRLSLDAVAGATLAAAIDAASAPRPVGPDGTRDLRTAAHRRGESLVHIADQYLGTRLGGTRTRPRVTVTVPWATVVEPSAFGAAPGELTVAGCGDRGGGYPLPPAVMGAVVCDADVVPVLVDSDGSPLDVGRTVYAFPEKIRAAIIARDGGCTFPHDCRRPPEWCQVHHTVPFSAGGKTSERTGVLVCTPGHLTTHREGWSVRVEGSTVIWSEPDRTARGGDPPRELALPPSWKPDLDRLVDTWRQRLTQRRPLADSG